MSETPRAPLDLTIRATVAGWPVDVHLSLPAEKVAAALERLAELGYSPRVEAAPATPQARPARPKVEPVYRPDGQACCPVHLRPLAEGRYGPFCSAKAAEGEEADRRGYCGLKFNS